MKRLICLILLFNACTDAPKQSAPKSLARADIFIPGNGYYFGDTDDFNSRYGLKPGDTVWIPGGDYKGFDIGKANGLVFINKGGQVRSPNFNLGHNVVNCKLLGNGDPAVKYGFKFSSPTYFGLGWDCVGDMEIGYVESDSNQIGIQVLSYQGRTYPTQVQNLYLHDCLISNAIQESVYLGHYIVGSIFMKVKVERIHIKNSGADGIQCRNGYFEIYNCDADGIGLTANSSNAQFILFGGNTNGSIAKFNYAKNVKGYGFFINGFGTFQVECNDVQSDAASIFSKNYEEEQDLQHVGYQTIMEQNNTLTSTRGVAFEHYYEVNGIPVTVTANNNKTAGVPNIQTGVKWTSTANSTSTVVSCGSTPPPPQPTKQVFRKGYWIINNKRFYYTLYTDSTWSNQK